MNIDFLSLVIAISAFFVAISAVRYQILILIYDQIGEKARECNSFLNKHKIEPNDTEMLVGILFSIHTTGELIDEYLRQHKGWFIARKKQRILDIYYLQLHVAVKGWLFEHTSDQNLNNSIMSKQFDYCFKLLERSHKKFTSVARR